MDKKLIPIKYITAEGKWICVDVSKAVKELLEQSDRQIRSQRRQDRRHHTEYRKDMIESIAIYPHEDYADLIHQMDINRKLHIAISKLPDVQQRRLRMYYFSGLTCMEIAKYEDVHHSTVVRSLAQARKTLSIYLSK